MYNWENDNLWCVTVTEKDFAGFEQPYLGNGFLGCHFDKLTAGTEGHLLCTLSRAVYDNGQQLFLPTWNNIGLSAGGVVYNVKNGKHKLSQTLDFRNGVVFMTDNWEYTDGKFVIIEMEMFVPRTFGQVSYLCVSVSGLTDKMEIKFGLCGSGIKGYADMSFSHVDNAVSGSYTTKIQKRSVLQALKWNTCGLSTPVVTTLVDEIIFTAMNERDNIKLELFHGVSSYDTNDEATEKVSEIYILGRDRLYGTNAAEWKRLWKSGLACGDISFEYGKALIAHQFHLLCSLEVCNYPLAPLGLSKNEWGGNQLWDGDLWLFRAVLPLWTDFAKSFIMFRHKTLEAAKNHAYHEGLDGAWYGWITDESGRNITPMKYNDEIHLNVWIALASWEYYVFTKDAEYLKEIGYPIISGIADFFASRAEYEVDDCYHLKCVVGPDESVVECGCLRVHDNFLTNFGAKCVMEAAIAAAHILKEKQNKRWSDFSEKIYLPQPDAYGIYPEYKNYNGHGIKQADAILAFYPLGFEADDDTVFKNIKFYRDKQMYYGPLMSSQIESCIMMQRGQKEKGMGMLVNDMNLFTRGKHYIPFECKDADNDNSIMMTGIGGELQALIFGYYGASLDDTSTIPRIGDFM